MHHTGKYSQAYEISSSAQIIPAIDHQSSGTCGPATTATTTQTRHRTSYCTSLSSQVTMDDFTKAKEKALYRKKGNVPEGLYL